jgi:hypothetical protein
MDYDWGPFYLVPSKVIAAYSGAVVLRDEYDEELLYKQVEERGFPRNLLRVTNAWFYRKKGTGDWTRIEESSDIRGNFPVRWDTTQVEDGQYEIIGFMQAFLGLDKWTEVTLGGGGFEKSGYRPVRVKRRVEKRLIAEQKTVEVTVENHPGLSTPPESARATGEGLPDKWSYLAPPRACRNAPTRFLHTVPGR